jgi:hypothetical protein
MILANVGDHREQARRRFHAFFSIMSMAPRSVTG